MGSDAKREDFTNGDPDTRSPGGGEAKDEHAGGENEDGTDSGGVGVCFRAYGGEDDEPCALPKPTNQEGLAATVAFDEPKTGEGGEDIDTAENDLGDVWVGKADGLEDGSSVLNIKMISTASKVKELWRIHT